MAPTYCDALFCAVSTSVQSANVRHCTARLWRYGAFWNCVPPTPDQVLFSSEKTMTCVIGTAVADQHCGSRTLPAVSSAAWPYSSVGSIEVPSAKSLNEVMRCQRAALDCMATRSSCHCERSRANPGVALPAGHQPGEMA